MGDAGAHLWISQADADWWAASRVLDLRDERSFCQALSKYQQTIEKSIKGIAAGLRDRMQLSIPIGYKHDVARIASALRRPAKPHEQGNIQHHINRLLTAHVLSEIKAIDELAPRRPAPGALHARNTEYPFETIAGEWTTPALRGRFTVHEVARFQGLARRVYSQSREIVSALRR